MEKINKTIAMLWADLLKNIIILKGVFYWRMIHKVLMGGKKGWGIF